MSSLVDVFDGLKGPLTPGAVCAMGARPASACRAPLTPTARGRPPPPESSAVSPSTFCAPHQSAPPPMAQERKRIGTDMILAKNLEDLAFRPVGIAGKCLQPGLSGRHFRLIRP